MAKELKKFTAEDLSRFTGENGSPIYVAYDGRVFDVTASRFWRGGMHMKRHPAGRDLTAEMSAAPHDMSVLDRYPQVGVLVPAVAPGSMQHSSAAEGGAAKGGAAEGGAAEDGSGENALEPRQAPTLRALIEQFLERHPFYRRHPHPMTVHFPIVFFIFSPLFTVLYLATGVSGFEITALNCLVAGLVFCLIVIPTGFFTWWINYDARPMRPVTIKIVLSLCMFVDGIIVLAWRLADPGVVTRHSGPSIPFLILDFLLLPMVVVVAWFGATLTFPLARTHRRGVSRS
jgi:predicted heme/steroid binding protein/uncharacterized membrane protein